MIASGKRIIDLIRLPGGKKREEINPARNKMTQKYNPKFSQVAIMGITSPEVDR